MLLEAAHLRLADLGFDSSRLLPAAESVIRPVYLLEPEIQKESSPAFIELKFPAVPHPKMISQASPLRVSVNRFQVAVECHFDPKMIRLLVHTLERL